MDFHSVFWLSLFLLCPALSSPGGRRILDGKDSKTDAVRWFEFVRKQKFKHQEQQRLRLIIWAGCLACSPPVDLYGFRQTVFMSVQDRPELFAYPSFAGSFLPVWRHFLSNPSEPVFCSVFDRRKLKLQAHPGSLAEAIPFHKSGLKTDPDATDRPGWINENRQKKRRTPYIRVLRQQISIVWLVKVMLRSAKAFHRHAEKPGSHTDPKTAITMTIQKRIRRIESFFVLKKMKTGLQLCL